MPDRDAQLEELHAAHQRARLNAISACHLLYAGEVDAAHKAARVAITAEAQADRITEQLRGMP